MVTELFYIPYILLSIPCLIFVISILLFLFALPVQVLISRCHLLLLSTYFKIHLSTAWNQQLIHSCWIWYIAISNIQQPYISVSVSCDTKEHQYTFRTASYSRSHSHTAICYIAISNIQQPYISVSVSCDTKERQYTFRTASYSRSHSHTAICYIAISSIQEQYDVIWYV